MASPRPVDDINEPVARDRKSTQRRRLVAGMVAAANHRGCAGANVSEVIAHARVSRPTFYDYFADKDDCFVAAQREIGKRLAGHVREAVDAQAPERAAQAAVSALIEHATAQPDEARFLTNEAMAGGPRAMDERDRLVMRLTKLVERAQASASPRAPTPDLPTRALLGSVLRQLAAPLRRGELDLRGFTEELTDWAERYSRPAREHRWRTLEPGPRLPASPHVSELSLHPPPPIARGRTRLSSQEIARNQRERILHATAEMAARKGYAATTIADIAGAASLDRGTFYAHFRDKHQAFLAVCELVAHQTLALAAKAFFSATAWPERIWEATHASTQFQSSNPTLTHLVLVESHAIGAPAVQCVDDTRNAFTIFLQEGTQHALRPISQRALQAVATAIFEIGYAQARAGRSRQMHQLTTHAVYLALTPLLGPHTADELIDGKLRELR